MNRRATVAPDADRRADRTAGRTTATEYVTVTCAGDGRSHVVAHVVLAESLATGTGQCTAVCGHVVLPASLASPPGSRCLLCSETAEVVGERREPRRRWYPSRG